jgi:origin recognition complex subunit 2
MSGTQRVSVSFQSDADDDISQIEEAEDYRSGRRCSSRGRSSLAAPDLDDVEEIAEDEEEAADVFQPQKMLGEEGEQAGRDIFSFRTPKKQGSMAEKVEKNTPSRGHTTPSSRRATPSGRKTPSSSCKTTPLKSGNSTPRSGPSTPLRGILKTPTGKQKRVEPETPASARKKVKKTLIRIVENQEEDTDTEDENEEEVEENEEDPVVLKGPPPTPRTPARKGRRAKGASDLNTSAIADGYFDAHANKVMTSDRTLSRLKTPRLSHGEVKDLVKGSGLRYEKEIRELVLDHQAQFPKWLSLLHRGFNIVTYGLGSKKSLIQDFHSSFLPDKDCIVVNGYFPSLTIKQVLDAISAEILEQPATFSSLTDHVQNIVDNVEDHVYLLVHNIDGSTLRNDKSQAVLAQLSAHPLIHLVCSIDHINAPLLWDQFKLAKFNFIWFDMTTFLPYTEETLYETSLMVEQSGTQALNSLTHVFVSLTPNAKKIYIIIIKYQLANEDDNYNGISFMELYRKCRSEFLVPSDLALRTQLTEFRDHKLVKAKKGGDGGEYLSIPLDKATLQMFLQNVEETL